MSDQFFQQMLKTSVVILCQKMGWDAAQNSSIELLTDLWKKHLLQVAKACHRYAEHYGRSQISQDDVSLSFRDLNISIAELEEYVQNFEPVKLPYRRSIKTFPIPKESHLNFLRPGSAEVLTRPVYIHEYMPTWEITPEEKVEKASGESNGIEKEDRIVSLTEPPKSPAPVKMEVDVKLKIEPHKPNSPLVSKEKAPDARDQETSVVEVHQTSIHPKREENPAIKRIRLLMEEEGHPLREISSVMMTTSGFLSSSREGRLPETKPPPNRDFFDPEPLIEKRKKSVTMKKIVEGVKKIEKENQDDVELFGKPDKLVTPEIKTKSNTSETVKKSRPLPVDSNSKPSKSVEKEAKADKLKIFKKKPPPEPEKHAKEEKQPEIKVEVKLEPSVEILPILPLDPMHELFTKQEFPAHSTMIVEERKKKKKDKEIHQSKRGRKREKELQPRTVPGVIPIPRISPNLTVPSMIVPQNHPQPLEKVIKHRKPIPALAAIDDLKPPKSKKIRHLNDIKCLIPEISINVSKSKLLPPPPELKPYFGAISQAPGLIPTTFGPPPPLKYGGSNLSPSITITPASTSASRENSRKGSNTHPISSNVCPSVTITRIEIPNSQQRTQFEHPVVEKPPPLQIHHDTTSGITITPILMTGDHGANKNEKGDKISSGSASSTLAKLDDDLKSKEQRRREKEKRRELKKEKKKEKREKERIQEQQLQQLASEELEARNKEKKHKEKRKESQTDIPTIPKLTLKIHSNASTPVDSPSRSSDRTDTPPPPRKITIKPIEDVIKDRIPSPELARFSPLVTRPIKPEKKVVTPKPSPPVSTGSDRSTSEKRRSSKSRKPSSSSLSQQSALVTETVGFYIDEHGNKVWICPAVGCGREDDGSPMIGCDICDDWYHFACVGIEETPDDNEHWYCPRCIKKQGAPRKRR